MWLTSSTTRTEPSRCKLTLRERNRHLEKTAFPYGLFLARDTTFPHLEVQRAVLRPLRLCVETKGMVLAPLFADQITWKC